VIVRGSFSLFKVKAITSCKEHVETGNSISYFAILVESIIGYDHQPTAKADLMCSEFPTDKSSNIHTPLPSAQPAVTDASTKNKKTRAKNTGYKLPRSLAHLYSGSKHLLKLPL